MIGTLAGVRIVVARRLLLANHSTTFLTLYSFRSVRCRFESMQGAIDLVLDNDASVDVALGALAWSESAGISHRL